VLWSRVLDLTDGKATLSAGKFSKLAIANPNSAPYGAAAVETMKALEVFDALQHRLVRGNSISQAFQFVDTRNAELGFVALAQLQASPRERGGLCLRTFIRPFARTRFS
jgi:molybdate transport system substrate-binding protein